MKAINGTVWIKEDFGRPPPSEPCLSFSEKAGPTEHVKISCKALIMLFAVLYIKYINDIFDVYLLFFIYI